MPTSTQIHQFADRVLRSSTTRAKLRTEINDHIDMAASMINEGALIRVNIRQEYVGDYLKFLLERVFDFIEDPNNTFRIMEEKGFFE